MTDSTRTFFDEIFLTFIKGYRLFLLLVGSAVLLGFIYAFFIKTPIFKSQIIASINEYSIQNQGSTNSNMSVLQTLTGLSSSNDTTFSEIQFKARSIEFANNFLALPAIQEIYKEKLSKKSPYELLQFYLSKISISQDKKSQLIFISANDEDPKKAKILAENLINYINLYYRNYEKEQTELKVKFINAALLQQQSIYLRNTLLSMLESEQRTKMMTVIEKDFKLKVIDPADSLMPKFSPKRLIIVALFFLISLMLSMIILIASHSSNSFRYYLLRSDYIRRLIGHEVKTN
jgi:capsular polysaccharide biosynthesis protein